MNTLLFERFIEIAAKLNTSLNVEPLLYGSLGLQIQTNADLNPKDIDILVPSYLLSDKWNELKEVLEDLGYTLVDLREHEFISEDNTKVAFAKLEELEEFAKLDYRNFEVRSVGKVRYSLMNLKEYLAVYSRSKQDGYRINNKEKNDQEKIELIIKHL